MVVGAPRYSTGALPISFFDRDYSGAAYILQNTNSLWTDAALLRASNAGGSYECQECELFACPTTGEGDGFGASVAIWGETVVVGAPGEASAATGVNGNESDDSGDAANQGDDSAIDAGAAYVFERMGGTWEQTQYLKASNVQEGYFFGATLAMTDTTLVVGSPGESSIGGQDSGAAYVFTLVDSAWTQTNFYKAFNADAGSAFAGPIGSVAFGQPSTLIKCEAQATTKGSSLSLDGDTLVVGAPYEDSAAIGVNGVPTSNRIPNSGAVYIFDNSEGQ